MKTSYIPTFLSLRGLPLLPLERLRMARSSKSFDRGIYCHILSWHAGPKEYESFWQAYEVAVAARLGHQVDRIGSRGAAILREASLMGELQLRGFLRSGAVYFSLCSGQDDLALTVLLSNVITTSSRPPGWLGSVELDFEESSSENSACINEHASLHDTHERTDITQKLALSHYALSESPSVGSFVQSFMQALIFRRLDSLSRFDAHTTSFTFRRAVYLNAHRADVTQVALLDAIVHETIHSFLHVCSATEGPFFLCPTNENMKLISPWTGRALNVDDFVHACFVWYGLANFWKLGALGDLCDRREVECRLTAASRGFLGERLARIMKPSEARPELIELVDTLQEDIRVHFG